MGDEDPTDIEIERFKEDGVQDTVRETIDACNSEARDETDATVREIKYKDCRSQTVRHTMADITGKNSSEITAVNVRRHIKRAAKQRVKDEMKAAGNKPSSTSEADRNAAVKTAIKEVMGLDNDPSDVDVEKYKLDAAKDSVLETMEACNEESRENTDEETADVTGKPENDITPTDIRRTIKHATKSRIRDVLKEVEKIPKSSKTEKDTFRNDQIKKAMKEVMGKDDDEDPTDIEIERFKEDGVQDTVRETIDACNSEARDET